MSTFARRVTVTAAAVVVAVAVWAVLTVGVGQELRSPAFGSGEQFDVTVGLVVITVLVASLAGWGLLTVLERVTARRAATVWRVVAAITLLVTLPLAGDGITTANRLSLVALHVTVAAVLIPALPTAGRSTGGA